MGFGRAHYKQVKQFVDTQIRNIPVFASHVDAFDWVISYIDMIPGCVEREDYEAAKAINDSIMDLIKEYGVEVPEGWKLDLSACSLIANSNRK